MKNLKKFVALLLAGVMAMVMLTACGGGTDTDEKKQALAYKVVSHSKQVNSASVTENDKELQRIAEGHLQDDLNASVDFLGAKWVAGFHVDGKKDKYLTITATSSYKAGYLIATLVDHLQDWVGSEELPDTNVNLNAKGCWTKLGVVVKTDPKTKQSYMQLHSRLRTPPTRANK